MAERYNDVDRLVDAALQSLEQWAQNQANFDIPIHSYAQTEESCVNIEPEKKRKRARTIFTPYQLAMLEKEYRYKKYLDKTSRLNLAGHLNLSDRQIKVWFQNRRMKDKRIPTAEQGPVDPACLEPPEQLNLFGLVHENDPWRPNYQSYYPLQPQTVPFPTYLNYQPPQYVDGCTTTQNTDYC